MLGALIGAGASLLGGFMGKKSAEKQAAQNIKLQKQFAQEGIQWKVKDAEAAGVHPLYALGAQTHSFSPISTGDPLGAAIADAGQNIGRAAETALTGSERLQGRLAQLSVQRAELENAKLASEVALLNQPGTPPPPHTVNPVVPGAGVEVMPAKVVNPVPGTPGRDPGVTPDTTFVATPNGYAPAPSEQTKTLIEDNVINELGWSLRNQLLPSIGVRSHTSPPPNSWLPMGADAWKWDVTTFQWRPFNSVLKEYRPIKNFGG